MGKSVIVTVYGSYNHGSFLQAEALKDELESMGHNVRFLDAGTRKWSVIPTVLNRSTWFGRRDAIAHPCLFVRKVCYEVIEALKIKKSWQSLKKCYNTEGCDFAVLGSDEIWNASRSDCRYPVYWGDGILCKKIAYAPSLNNANYSDLEHLPEILELLNDIDSISVRDVKSKNELSKIISKEIKVVLDPTFLHPQRCERIIHSKKQIIAVYSFLGHIPEEEIIKIVDWSHKNNFELVSLGQYNKWCDRNVHSFHGNPFYLYQNSRFVITSTFHGTAYAINYGVPFVAFVKGNEKVENLLKEFNLSDRIAETADDMVRILNGNPIDYKKVNFILDNKRKESNGFLIESIKQLEESI